MVRVRVRHFWTLDMSHYCHTRSGYFCQTVDMSDHWHVRLPACNWNIVSAKKKKKLESISAFSNYESCCEFFFKNLTLDGCRYHFFQKLDFFFFFNSKSYSNHHIVTESWMDMPPNVFVHAPPPPPPPKKKKKKRGHTGTTNAWGQGCTSYLRRQNGSKVTSYDGEGLFRDWAQYIFH